MPNHKTISDQLAEELAQKISMLNPEQRSYIMAIALSTNAVPREIYSMAISAAGAALGVVANLSEQPVGDVIETFTNDMLGMAKPDSEQYKKLEIFAQSLRQANEVFGDGEQSPDVVH